MNRRRSQHHCEQKHHKQRRGLSAWVGSMVFVCMITVVGLAYAISIPCEARPINASVLCSDVWGADSLFNSSSLNSSSLNSSPPQDKLYEPLADPAVRFRAAGSVGAVFQTMNFRALPEVAYLSTEPYRPRPNPLAALFANPFFADVAWNAAAEVSLLLAAPRIASTPVPFRVSLRGDYHSLSVQAVSEQFFLTNPPSPINPNDLITRVPRLTRVQREISMQIGTFGVVPSLECTLFAPLTLGAGARFAFPVQSAVELRQHVGAPATFVSNGLSQRIDTAFASYDQLTRVQTSLVLRARYDIPLPNVFSASAGGEVDSLSLPALISPELAVELGLNNLVQSVLWRASSVKIGVVFTVAAPRTPLPPLALPAKPLPEEGSSKRLATSPPASKNSAPPASSLPNAWANTSTNASVSPSTLAPVIVIDTVYSRDTTVQLVSWKELAAVRLAERTEKPDFITTAATDRQVTDRQILRITEQYKRSIPRPKPALAGNLDVLFVAQEKSSGSIEGKKVSRLTLETFGLREFRSTPDTLVFDRQDTIYALIPPPLKFTAKLFSEAGLRSVWVQLSQQTSRFIAAIPCLPQKITQVEWSAERDAALFPERSIRAARGNNSGGADVGERVMLQVPLQCSLVAEDNEDQRTLVDTATIVFEHAPIPASALPTRSILAATLAVPTLAADSAVQERLRADNLRVADVFAQEWNAIKTSSASSVPSSAASSVQRKLSVVLPIEPGNLLERGANDTIASKEYSKIRLYVYEVLQYMKIPSSQVVYVSSPSVDTSPSLPSIRLVLEKKMAKQ